MFPRHASVVARNAESTGHDLESPNEPVRAVFQAVATRGVAKLCTKRFKGYTLQYKSMLQCAAGKQPCCK